MGRDSGRRGVLATSVSTASVGLRRCHSWCAFLSALLCVAAFSFDAVGAQEAKPQKPDANTTASATPPELTLETFLDRLMLAESGGNDWARNQRSTAFGPFQFINSTFLSVARQHFAEETAALPPSAVLALRTDRSFARRAAAAYTKDNAALLEREGLKASFPNLRLAYLVGPSGAVRVLHSPPETKVADVLSSAAIKANPFMRRMTVADLMAKCARDLSVKPGSRAGIIAGTQIALPKRRRPLIDVKCNLRRPSCRRWLALAKAKLKRKKAREAKNRASLR